MRHSAQYADPEAPELTEGDAAWAMATARSVLDGARRIGEMTDS